MVAKLYKNKSDNIIMNKSISQQGPNLTVHMKEDTNVIEPTFYISRTVAMLDVNYIYVTELKRYYFIESIETSQQYFIVKCKVDVLMTFKSEILKQSCIVARNQSRSKMYLQDEKLKLYNMDRYEVIPFESGFLQDGAKVSNFVLTLNGGGNV